MNALFIAAALALLSSASVAAAESTTRSVSITNTQAGAIGHCNGEVVRNVSVCDEQGDCQVRVLNEELKFSVPRGGSFTLSATTISVDQAGIIHGNASVDRFSAARANTELVQILTNGQRCSYSFSYDISVR